MATTEQPAPTAILAENGLSVEELYDELTGAGTTAVRLDDLLYEAAERVPGLTPTRTDVEAERGRKLADKHGVELAQGLLTAEILANPRTFRRPVPYTGRLGLFLVSEEVAAAALRQVATPSRPDR